MGVQRNPAGAGAREGGTAGTRFVLVEPQTGGNVGSACRALKNLGFGRLVLVRPQCDPLGAEARTRAVDAIDVLEAAERHESLDAAVARARSVIGTTGRVGKYRKPHHRLDHFTDDLAQLAATGELAIVFGRENHGLSDDELDRCTHLVRFPAGSDYVSFNLAHSVLLMAYELRCASARAAVRPALAPAAHAEREAMYGHLESALLSIGFLQPDSVRTMMRRFRRLFGRAGVTSEEARMLRGMARQMLWVASQTAAGPGAGGEPRTAGDAADPDAS